MRRREQARTLSDNPKTRNSASCRTATSREPPAKGPSKKYRNPAKNIDDCVTYILNYVQKSGCNGFTDGEIYGQAVHYYDENEIEMGKPIQCHVAVNHVVELTAEEKAEARQNAIRQYQDEEVRRLQNRNKPRTATKATVQEVQQPSLFDLGL